MSNGDIRFKEQIGIVTSEASSEQFKFFVTPLTNNLGVGKDDYIIIEYNLYGKPCPLLAVVKDLINYEEVIGTSIRENKSVKTIATGEIIGCVDIRNPEVKILRKISTPPTPGCRVFLPYLEFLEDVFSRTQTGKLLKRPLHIGELLNANSKQGGLKPLNFYLDFENLTNNHMLISAISGHGKTSLASVIVEEIVSKIGLSTIILDPFSEYTTIGYPYNFIDKSENADEQGVNSSFSFEVKVLAFDNEGLVRRIEKGGIDRRLDDKLSIQPFPRRLPLSASGEEQEPTRDELNIKVKHSNVTILDSNGLSQKEARKLFTNYVDKLLDSRLGEYREPFLLVIEDAKYLEADTLIRIASEGRKLRVTMCLLSQHPSEIDAKILSQIGIHFIGRTVEATDLGHFKQLVGDKFTLIPQLEPGEWIVSTNLNRPIKLHSKKRLFTKYLGSLAHASKHSF